MSFTREELGEKMAALANSSSFEDLRELYRLCSTNQWNYDESKKFIKRGLWKQYVGQVTYRPFDRQWTVLHKHVLTILRKQVMSQLSGKEKNLGLISSRAVNDFYFAHCFVTNEPVDKIFISSKTSTNAYVFPLFIQGNDIFGKERHPNLSRSFLMSLADVLGVRTTNQHSIPEGLKPEDIFYFAYAVFHSPDYRSRYAEFLKIDFPRLPLTGSLELFRALAKLGGELTALHLLESPKLKKPITKFIGRDPVVSKVGWTPDHGGTVWLDGKGTAKNFQPGTSGFRPVPEEVWNFHIGGYQVCEKWLKDRGPKKGKPGRTLSQDDIAHYHKIVIALSETMRIMAEIDEVIEQHGGWPDAFATQTEDLPKVAEDAAGYDS